MRPVVNTNESRQAVTKFYEFVKSARGLKLNGEIPVASIGTQGLEMQKAEIVKMLKTEKNPEMNEYLQKRLKKIEAALNLFKSAPEGTMAKYDVEVGDQFVGKVSLEGGNSHIKIDVKEDLPNEKTTGIWEQFVDIFFGKPKVEKNLAKVVEEKPIIDKTALQEALAKRTGITAKTTDEALKEMSESLQNEYDDILEYIQNHPLINDESLCSYANNLSEVKRQAAEHGLKLNIAEDVEAMLKPFMKK